MLTALEIENFKGIGARQRIDFAPLTLLFGANSAGKSTILQSLLYLHEVIERGSGDVDRTELGGSTLELGGFSRLVHKHDRRKPIVLRAEFATPGGIERFGRDLTGFAFPDLDDEVESAWVELRIRFRQGTGYRGAFVEYVSIGVNGESASLVELETQPNPREGEPLFAYVNLDHPIFPQNEDERRLLDEWNDFSTPREVLEIFRKHNKTNEDAGEERFEDEGRRTATFLLRRGRFSALPSSAEPLRLIPPDERGGEGPAEHLTEQIRTFLEMIVLGTTAQLAGFLRDALYIGPLRSIPPRGFLYERTGRLTSWADGLAAWDQLLRDRRLLVEETNAWLRKLGAGCRVVVQQLFEGSFDVDELSDDHVDKTVRRLMLDTGMNSLVLPSEVGAGVSQLMPVVVAALENRAGLTLIEQPEIHVHPAVQVSLGDLLIDAVTRNTARRSLLIETHSEHLILRVLRRIRETTEKESNDGPQFSEKQLSVLYVESGTDGCRIRRLRVDENGEFVDRWPKGFFNERMKELL